MIGVNNNLVWGASQERSPVPERSYNRVEFQGVDVVILFCVTFGLNARLDLSREATTKSLCQLGTKLRL